MRVLILGNSQTLAMARGHRDWVAKGHSKPGLDLKFRLIGTGRELQEKFYAVNGNEFSTTGEKTGTFTFRGGAVDFDAVGLVAPYFSSLVCRDPDWMTFGLAPNCAGKTPVSRHLVEEVTRLSQRYVLGFMDALQAAGTQVFAVEAARLVRDSPLLQQNDEALVAQIDEIFCQTMAMELQKRSIGSVRVAKESCDDMGFLLPEHRSPKEGDHIHANDGFGLHMVQQTIAFLTET